MVVVLTLAQWAGVGRRRAGSSVGWRAFRGRAKKDVGRVDGANGEGRSVRASGYAEAPAAKAGVVGRIGRLA